MNLFRNISRRTVLKTGLIAATSTVSPAVAAEPDSSYIAQFRKNPGETKIVAVMGDYWHPASSQENHVRQIFSSCQNWKIYFVLASRYLTAELLSDTDLFIASRYGGSDSPAWTPEPIVAERPGGDMIWTDEQVDALCENVKNRGMGFMAVHCTLFCGRKKIEDLMGIEPLLHQEMQPVVYHDINGNHPITRGIKPFYVTLDDQFEVQIKEPSRTTVLFKCIAVHDKRVSVNGWCIEQSKGRVVGLLPGHHQFIYRMPQYQEIFWGAAHWAMNREIPPYPNTSTDTKGFV